MGQQLSGLHQRCVCDSQVCANHGGDSVEQVDMVDTKLGREQRVTLAVIRHGERLDAVNPSLWYKSKNAAMYPFDCPITDTGRDQARFMGQDLKQRCGDTFSMVISSPFVRCVQTSVEICRVLKLPICIDAELGEIYGPTTMGNCPSPGPPRRTPQEVRPFVPPDIEIVGQPAEGDDIDDGCHSGFIGEAPEWPESLAEARLRMASRVEQHAARGVRLGGANFVLVTHGDCVHTSLTLALHSQKVQVQSVKYCAFAIFQRTFVEGEGSVGLMDEDAGWTVQWGNVTLADRSCVYDVSSADGKSLKQEEMALRQIRDKRAQKAQDGRRRSSRILKGALQGALGGMSPKESDDAPKTVTPLLASVVEAEDFGDKEALVSLAKSPSFELQFSEILPQIKQASELLPKCESFSRINKDNPTSPPTIASDTSPSSAKVESFDKLRPSSTGSRSLVLEQNQAAPEIAPEDTATSKMIGRSAPSNGLADDLKAEMRPSPRLLAQKKNAGERASATVDTQPLQKAPQEAVRSISREKPAKVQKAPESAPRMNSTEKPVQPPATGGGGAAPPPPPAPAAVSPAPAPAPAAVVADAQVLSTEKLKITVHIVSGGVSIANLEAEVTRDALPKDLLTCTNIKEAIRDLSMDDVKTIHNGKMLQPTDTFEASGIKAGAEIVLIFKKAQKESKKVLQRDIVKKEEELQALRRELELEQSKLNSGSSLPPVAAAPALPPVEGKPAASTAGVAEFAL